MKKKAIYSLVCVALILGGCSKREEAIQVGALYPIGGAQGPGGLAESRGVSLAAELMNELGGVKGRQIEITTIDVPGSDAAIPAVRQLSKEGIDLVVGSYGSTISRPAAAESAARGMLYWETGAVGEMTGDGAGDLVFRVSPTGAILGSGAVEFIAERVAPASGRDASKLRFAVANVDDVYGNAVARGAIKEIADRRLPYAGNFTYDARRFDAKALIKRIAASKPDVLFVSAYLEDGIAIRKEMVRQHLSVLSNIGTSSSYCMKEFGKVLGADAIGLFASDKPDHMLNPKGLQPAARSLLTRANASFSKRYNEPMDPPALAGFSAAWALFHDVMPAARSLDAKGIAAAARSLTLPMGALPNGSGLEFGKVGSADAGANVRAASVIWEWMTNGKRAVVWPPQYATESVRVIKITA